MIRLAIVDADLIVYEAAFCAEKKEKEGVYLNWYQVSKIVNTIVRKILKKSKCTHHTGFLTEGHSNFRVARAFSLPYKGQRKTNKSKPAFYDEIREYLMSNWGYQMMRGVEADDALTIVSEKYKDDPNVVTVICTKDKDLWQYAGHHYNMNTCELMVITPEQAHKNLWRQMLKGDLGTDNIPGLSHHYKYDVITKKVNRYGNPDYITTPCQKFGDKTCENLLDSWDPKDYDRNTYELYVDCYDQDDGDDFAEQRFLETFDLIYMLLEAPKGLEIHYEYIKVKTTDLQYDNDLGDFHTKNEFSDF
jgi:5'-3' exonuclease